MFQEKEYVSGRSRCSSWNNFWTGERTFTLLDVREQKEYEAGHLLGAVNLPYEQLDEVEAEITKDRPVVIYCAYGGQSLLAARENSRTRV